MRCTCSNCRLAKVRLKTFDLTGLFMVEVAPGLFDTSCKISRLFLQLVFGTLSFSLSTDSDELDPEAFLAHSKFSISLLIKFDVDSYLFNIVVKSLALEEYKSAQCSKTSIGSVSLKLVMPGPKFLSCTFQGDSRKNSPVRSTVGCDANLYG
ncbi:hypothetical protein BpHYR1_016395 [Brachionus plicatilis]|uniref:Uncharacterized protein n=1 Tax=Brachionus plicatilis TaxID=10195 RepID=A0A3M7SXE4_BRAPC|nr:hypothetical protein BpHYR1_016395 [Brachionus plicatilis]